MRLTWLLAAMAGWMFAVGSPAGWAAGPVIVNGADAKWTWPLPKRSSHRCTVKTLGIAEKPVPLQFCLTAERWVDGVDDGPRQTRPDLFG